MMGLNTKQETGGSRLNQLLNKLERKISNYFDFKQNKTSLKTEILAGITTFLATMYIIIINPMILSSTGMSFSGVLTATVLVSAFSSIMMGIYAKNPIVLAPGMGINTFFAYSLVLGRNESWEVALGVVFLSGIIFLILSVFNIRIAIIRSIPKNVNYSGLKSRASCFAENSFRTDKTYTLSTGLISRSPRGT